MVRVINVGLGVRGRMWTEWAKAAGAEVVGVVDANPETVARHGAALGFGPERTFTSVPDAVKRLRPQAAIVCAPNHVHPILARTCLEQGLHLLIEKPMAQDMATAEELVALAERNGLQFAVAQQYRYRQSARRICEALHTGEIGVPTSGLVQFYRWRPTKRMRLPILLNQAIHHFDTIRAVFGSTPVACSAELWNPDWNVCDGPTIVEATFRFADGVRIHYSGSYVAQGRETPYDGLWRLEGRLGQLTFDGDSEIRIRRREAKEETVERVAPEETSVEMDLCRDFLQAVETGTPVPTSGRDNLQTLAMVFAIELSSRLRREVTLGEAMSGQR